MSERVAIYQQKAETHNQVRRCDGCKWWVIPEMVFNRDGAESCDKLYTITCDWERHMAEVVTPPDFYCKYWEAKDEA